MALNNDFKVKNSLYVGNSAYFVTQTDTPTILSAGNSLFDIFLQEGEGGSGILSDGDGITDFMFDSLSAATVAVDATVVRTAGDQTIGDTKTFTALTPFNAGLTAAVGGVGTIGLSATAANSGILSAGKDLNEIFQIIGSDSRGKVLSEGIGIQDFTYE